MLLRMAWLCLVRPSSASRKEHTPHKCTHVYIYIYIYALHNLHLQGSAESAIQMAFTGSMGFAATPTVNWPLLFLNTSYQIISTPHHHQHPPSITHHQAPHPPQHLHQHPPSSIHHPAPHPPQHLHQHAPSSTHHHHQQHQNHHHSHQHHPNTLPIIALHCCSHQHRHCAKSAVVQQSMPRTGQRPGRKGKGKQA